MFLSLLVALPVLVAEPSRDEYFKAFKTPAMEMVAVITNGDKSVWTGTRGATLDTPFRIASLTKAFTAAVILQLSAEGKVKLDEPVAKVLTPWPDAWKEVSVRQLLNHTSGIPSYTSQPDFVARIGEPTTPADLLARTAKLPLKFAPGTSFEYNNSGYVVLGMIAEALDKKPMAEVLKTRLFGPLGMEKTYLNVAKAPEALGLDENGKPAIALSMTQPYAAGSIVSTGADMARWVSAQGLPSVVPDSVRAGIREPVKLPDGRVSGYSSGWQIKESNGIRLLLHTGGIPGYSTVAVYVPSTKAGVVVLTNSNGGNPSALALKLAESEVPGLRQTFPAVPDPDVSVTNRVKDLLFGFSIGAPDLKQFSEQMKGVLTPNTVTALERFMRQAGDVTELRLIGVKGAQRVYRVECAQVPLRLTVEKDEEGKFSLWQITGF